MADALLWPPETPLSVNHHVCDFHRVESLPDSSWWLSTKDFVDFVCPFSVSNNEKNTSCVNTNIHKRKLNLLTDFIVLPTKTKWNSKGLSHLSMRIIIHYDVIVGKLIHVHK